MRFYCPKLVATASLTSQVQALLASYLQRWMLIPDGVVLTTHSSYLLPVKQGDSALMLKLAVAPEERQGNGLMVWWAGKGAARVIQHHEEAILLERATGKHSLVDLVRQGQDTTASRILCRVAAQLHAPRQQPIPALIPLPVWFSYLEIAAEKNGGILAQSAQMARALLANPQDVCLLHGDLHHANVLDFGQRGWLAIDPKGLVGERAFDFANILCNPSPDVALLPSRFACQVHVLAQATHLDPTRLLQWVLAWAGLSASWLLLDELDPGVTLSMAILAASELAKSEGV